MRNKLLVIAIIAITLRAFAQVPGNGDATATGINAIMELVETNSEENGSNADFNTILEQLAYYEANPIDLNNTSVDNLKALGLLNEYQIKMIMDHRQTYGNFVDTGELFSLPGFDNRTVELLLPYFTTIDKIKVPQKKLTGGRHTFIMRTQRILETQRGYTSTDVASPPAYGGDPWKHYMRYRYQAGTHFGIGFTVEKDAGEDFFSGSNAVTGPTFYKGFDYHSAHLYFRTN